MVKATVISKLPLGKHIPLRGKFRTLSLHSTRKSSKENLPRQRRFSISLRTKSFSRSGPILKFQRSSVRELIDRRRGGWGRHHRRKLSEPHHGFAQIAFPAESGRKRIPSGLPGCGRRNIGGSCEKRRIQLASSPLRFSRGVGEFVLFPSNGTCSIIDALVNDLFLYRKQLRTEARGKKGKFVISSHASSRINPRIIDRIATALKREQKSTRVTMN